VANLTFISGLSGSGTTLATKILSAPPEAVSLGGNYTKWADNEGPWAHLSSKLMEATLHFWDREAEVEDRLAAKAELLEVIQAIREYDGVVRHVFFKRSAPFQLGDRYRPDLSDLAYYCPDLKFIILFRDPCAATYSAFRRGHNPTLRKCAAVCEEQLTILASQAQLLNASRVFVFGYDQLVETPGRCLSDLAAFCGMETGPILEAARILEIRPGENDKWRIALPPQHASFLDEYFERRQGQWRMLLEATKRL
jgi:hypothetical protein